MVDALNVYNDAVDTFFDIAEAMANDGKWSAQAQNLMDDLLTVPHTTEDVRVAIGVLNKLRGHDGD